MKQSLIAVAAAALSLAACAQSSAPATSSAKPAATPAAAPKPAAVSGTAADNARMALMKLDVNLPIDRIGDAPLPGFQQAIVAGQVVYVSNDGRYLLQGALFDMQEKKNLAEAAMSGLRQELLKEIPRKDRIVFAAPEPKYTVSVFTDAECGYCRKLHSEIAQYNRLGITVEYMAFPRQGPASDDFKLMESVWCAADRAKALTDAKNGRTVAPRRCTSPVAAQYALGQRMGLQGTPMILTDDGLQLGGYLPPEQLRAALDKRASEAGKGKPPGA